jgi:hypothetical protein
LIHSIFEDFETLPQIFPQKKKTPPLSTLCKSFRAFLLYNTRNLFVYPMKRGQAIKVV